MCLCFFKRCTPPYLVKKDGKLKGKPFFSHGHSNSCGVAICFLGNINFNILHKIQDNDGKMLILDVQADDTVSFCYLIHMTLIKNVSNLMF